MAVLNALTVDVEDYFHVSAFSGDIDRQEWPSLPSRVEGNTRRLMDLFDRFDVRATFFVLGWVAERFPELIREIHERSHEVACHGLSHELIYNQTPEVFRAETIRSKVLLEDLIAAPVVGYRAASFSITRRSLWAIDILAEAGFEYDSSIVRTRHDLYGIANAEAAPHEIVTPAGGGLVEFPPPTASVLGQDVPIGGGGYFRLYPYWLTRSFLRRVNGTRQIPFVFYLHPWEVDPEQPRVRTNFRSRFRHYLNLDKTESRLHRLFEDFEFAPVRQVLTGLMPLQRHELADLL